MPKAESQRSALGQQIGEDGLHRLHALEQPEVPAALKEITSVHLLKQVWQQYDDLSDGQIKWRAGPHAHEGEGIMRSPSDPEAQTGNKRETTWFGYNVPVTETGALETSEHTQAPPMPQLMVQVQTTVAHVQDVERMATMQEELAKQDLLPEEQLVATGYVAAALLGSRHQNHGSRVVGPVLSDTSWQAKAGRGFAVAHVQLDWQNQQATCPQGHLSSRWSVAGERMAVVFPPEICARGPVRSEWTHSQTTGRVLHPHPQEAHEALQARRHEQQTLQFRHASATRAGIEGTLSQAVRGMGVRRARSDGLPKVQVQPVLTAVAINLVRIDAVLTNTPRGKTRQSHFTRLALHPALAEQHAA